MVLRNRNGQFRRRGSFNNNFFSADNTLAEGIANFEFKMYEAMDEVAADFAMEMEAYARSNAPWEDRTGDARGGLTGQVDTSAETGTLSVNLFHTVDYGVWLEIRWGGKYAIIIPTMENMGPKLLQKMEGMMDRIVFYA